jgi:hypothetical protein
VTAVAPAAPQAPTPAALLAAWEAGAGAAAPARGAAALDVLLDAPPRGSTVDLPLPRLAGLAARCHTALFGPDVEGVLECPACGAVLDVAVRLDDLFAPVPEVPPAPEPVVRCPTTRDLVEVASLPAGVTALLERCVPGVDLGSLTPSLIQEIDRALEEVAGPALPVLRAACPQCSADVRAVVDAPALLWQRIDEFAPRLLEEVARLAAAFGWSEADVLALGPHRRAAYLALVTP